MEIERGKVRTREEIMACFKDGQTIAIGGQAGAYMPWDLLDMLEESGVKHLTICSIDACNPGFAISRLIENGQVDKMITTHIGTNPVAQKLLAEGKLEVEFFPMGSFIEKMRDGGAGIGGFLTKTGLGTDMEKGKQIVTTSDGRCSTYKMPSCRSSRQPCLPRNRYSFTPCYGNMCRYLHRTVRPVLRLKRNFSR